jgi:co-chaperonin GroES (HSP10)
MMHKFDYIPTGFRVVIRQKPIERKTKGGIIINVGEAGKMQQAGQCVGYLDDIGDLAFIGKDYSPADRERYEYAMKNGIEILYRKYAGEGKSADDEDPDSDVFHICADSDVLGIKRPREAQ